MLLIRNLMLIQYNISRNRLADAIKLTPGKRSPTVSSLEGEDAVAVSALVKKNDTASLMLLLNYTTTNTTTTIQY